MRIEVHLKKTRPVLQAFSIYEPLRYIYKSIRLKYQDLTTSDADILRKQLVPEEKFKAKLREAVSLLINSEDGVELGDYLEFGVYNGVSLACMYSIAAEFDLSHMRFFGFDSFQGLPKNAHKEDDGIWVPGQYSCPIDLTRVFLTQRGIDWNRVFLIKGWFTETLTDATVEEYKIKKSSIILVDCDMYSSARDALCFVEPLIQDQAVIIFDDWFTGGLDQKNMGEERAFVEFLNAHPNSKATDIESYNENSRMFHWVREP